MAYGCDKARARIICNDGVERSHSAKNVSAAIGRALSADALDDVGERRIDVVCALALDVVELLQYI